MARKFPLKIVDDTLKKVFFKLGVMIGKNPGYFIIVPLLLTALCASGFQRMDYNYDPEYLLSPGGWDVPLMCPGFTLGYRTSETGLMPIRIFMIF